MNTLDLRAAAAFLHTERGLKVALRRGAFESQINTSKSNLRTEDSLANTAVGQGRYVRETDPPTVPPSK